MENQYNIFIIFNNTKNRKKNLKKKINLSE